MTKMRLKQIIDGIAITDRRGRLEQEILGITPDSREVKKGDLFIAIRGIQSDGHEFVKDALQKGATAILAEEWSEPEIPEKSIRPDVILVPNSRRAIALSAANYYGQPSRKLLVAGVTGTNGKTTVSYVLESIMKAASRKVGVIGTIGHRYGDIVEEGTHTTPNAVKLQETLSKMKENGTTHVVMEVSSHALDQERVAGVHFKVAGFTNLTQDHLDYHKDLEDYFAAKSRLFSNILPKSRARGRMAVVNVDDPKGEQIIETWGGKSLRVSSGEHPDADVVATEKSLSLDGSTLTVKTPKGIWNLECALVGEHNVSNILVGMGMALAMGFSRARIERGLKSLKGVPGRLEKVEHDGDAHVFVDYAHTPDALTQVLKSLRPLVEKRIIVVFGCGGDRDQEKRALMGAAVAAGADLAVVTNDNPRSEEPSSIAEAIEGGLSENGWSTTEGEQPEKKSFVRQLDRREAIRTALSWSDAGDLVLIAGKGHETTQLIGNTSHYFSDVEEAHCLLNGLPPPAPRAIEGETEVSVSGDDIEEVSDAEISGEASASPLITAEVELSSIESVAEIESDSDEEEGPPEDSKP